MGLITLAEKMWRKPQDYTLSLTVSTAYAQAVW